MFLVLTIKHAVETRNHEVRLEAPAPRLLSRDAWRVDQRGSCRAKFPADHAGSKSCERNKAVGGISLTLINILNM